jgi:hypothetical protein
MRSLLRIIAAATIALFALATLAESAEAQRRRRPRPRRPPAAEVEETPPEEPPVEETTPVSQPTALPAQEAEPLPGGESYPEGEPGTTPTAEFDPGPAPPDVSPIRADYVALMDDLVQARMRVGALGAELFHTRIKVDLQDRTGDNVAVARLVVHLDGAPVFQSDGPVENASNGREIFTGSLAPGPHVLTLEVEQRARDDDAYRYTLRESYRFQVVRERLSEVTLVLEDGSDMARSFPSGGEGHYEVRTRMRVATRALPTSQ